MRRIFLLILLAASVGKLNAQKTIEDQNVEKRSVGSFHGVSVSTGIKLMLSEGATEEVAVSANKAEYRDKIMTKVENGVLKIYYENKLGAITLGKEKKELTAYVSYKKLDELNATTGAIVEIEGVLKGALLKMKANTGATVNGVLKVDALDVEESTGAVVSLSGEAGSFHFDGNLGSVFNGENLKTTNSTAEASTGTTVSIAVQKELFAKANTGGTVKYKGDAKLMKSKTGTGGSVVKI